MISAYIVPGILPRIALAEEKKILSQHVISTICSYLNIKESQVLVHSRKRRTVYSRQLMTYFLIRKAGSKLKQIADLFDQDHTTVIYSREKVIQQLTSKIDNEYKRDVDEILKLLNQNY